MSDVFEDYRQRCFSCHRPYDECQCPVFPLDEGPKRCWVCGATDHEEIEAFGGMRIIGCPEVPRDKPIFFANPAIWFEAKEKAPESFDPEACEVCGVGRRCVCLPL